MFHRWPIFLCSLRNLNNVIKIDIGKCVCVGDAKHTSEGDAGVMMDAMQILTFEIPVLCNTTFIQRAWCPSLTVASGGRSGAIVECRWLHRPIPGERLGSVF